MALTNENYLAATPNRNLIISFDLLVARRIRRRENDRLENDRLEMRSLAIFVIYSSEAAATMFQLLSARSAPRTTTNDCDELRSSIGTNYDHCISSKPAESNKLFI